MWVEYDEFNNLYDINYECDLCDDCLYNNECVLVMAIASSMVNLNNTQPLEACNFYKKNNWINRLINRR